MATNDVSSPELSRSAALAVYPQLCGLTPYQGTQQQRPESCAITVTWHVSKSTEITCCKKYAPHWRFGNYYMHKTTIFLQLTKSVIKVITRSLLHHNTVTSKIVDDVFGCLSGKIFDDLVERAELTSSVLTE